MTTGIAASWGKVEKDAHHKAVVQAAEGGCPLGCGDTGALVSS